ncbi:DUF2946 domain-containing protein [Hydrogenophaga sp. A37]|uniref:DUF2946 domain-containing protein n=1 Tax=Hydrogenophaga sp. A37 TaxID=1945864 RepID=UPI000987046A|nr:DUF2946 domain-containing protein [Hydrogenophaga sp. A37]OOG80171.1 hypothetical protein B0E41_21300 [Hydrogenophaga sp. A37]
MSLACSPLLRRIARGLVFAMLLATLAPAVSRTLASWRVPGQGGWMEVCSAGGVQRLTGDQGAEAPSQPTHLTLDACALCVLATERFAPLMPAAWAMPPGLGGSPLPEALPWRFAAWSTLRPSARGPPTVS